MSTRGKWIKLMSKTLKFLKEKYEGKSFSVILGNRVNGGAGGGGGCGVAETQLYCLWEKV